MLSVQWINLLQNGLKQKGIDLHPIIMGDTISGGSINQCYQLRSGTEQFFLKWNVAAKHPDMFLLEAKGLELLRSANAIKIPEVIACGVIEDYQYLLLGLVEKGPNTMVAQQQLGQQLAAMHKTTGSYWGLDHDNYMGSLTQSNRPEPDCAAYFTNQRLLPQLRLAVRSGMIGQRLHAKFDQLFARLPNLIPAEPPALTHGDCGVATI